jgi:Uma2 family endonuclease
MKVAKLSIQTLNFLDTLKNLTSTISVEDRIYIVTGISWQQYQQINSYLEEQSHYRLSYLDGTLTIMSPGRSHEIIKEYISGLLEVYFQELEIDYYPLGSTTLKIERQQTGKEPDVCYCIKTEKEIPDLAIEVVFSSGGIDSLKIHQYLQVKEVWFWQNNRLKIYILNDLEYQQSDRSVILPELNLELFQKYILQSNIRLAIKQYRKELQNRS